MNSPILLKCATEDMSFVTPRQNVQGYKWSCFICSAKDVRPHTWAYSKALGVAHVQTHHPVLFGILKSKGVK